MDGWMEDLKVKNIGEEDERIGAHFVQMDRQTDGWMEVWMK
jgi:hypothetical protein